MQITFTGDTIDHLLPLAAKDKNFAKALAQQLLDSIDPAALGNYLLENGVALVATRLSNAPEETLRELLRLASVHPPTTRCLA